MGLSSKLVKTSLMGRPRLYSTISLAVLESNAGTLSCAGRATNNKQAVRANPGGLLNQEGPEASCAPFLCGSSDAVCVVQDRGQLIES